MSDIDRIIEEDAEVLRRLAGSDRAQRAERVFGRYGQEN